MARNDHLTAVSCCHALVVGKEVLSSEIFSALDTNRGLVKLNSKFQGQICNTQRRISESCRFCRISGGLPIFCRISGGLPIFCRFFVEFHVGFDDKIDADNFVLLPDLLTSLGCKLAFVTIWSLLTGFKDAFFATFAYSFLRVNYVYSCLEMLVSFIIRGLLLADGTVIKFPVRLPVCERILILRGTLGTARALHFLTIHNFDADFETTESL